MPRFTSPLLLPLLLALFAPPAGAQTLEERVARLESEVHFLQGQIRSLGGPPGAAAPSPRWHDPAAWRYVDGVAGSSEGAVTDGVIARLGPPTRIERVGDRLVMIYGDNVGSVSVSAVTSTRYRVSAVAQPRF